jgi:hypothetical protein
MKRYRTTNNHDRNPFDRNGLLRPGRSYRTSMRFMDSAMPRDLRQPSHRPLIVDAGNKPGWRIPAQDARPLIGRVVTDAGNRAARQAAYDTYHTTLENAWRGNADPGFGGDDTCGGTGMVDHYEENAEDIVRNAATHTESARHRDHRTAQMMRDHQNEMADIYDKLDHDLSQAWRRS